MRRRPILPLAILLASCSKPVPPPVTPPQVVPAVPTPAPTPIPAPSPAPLAAPPVRSLQLCGRGTVNPAPDGRLFGHLPYPDAPESALVSAPPELGGACRVNAAVVPDLQRLLARAATDPTVAGRIRAVSCHRSTAFQRQTFCAGITANESGSFAERAWASAPPGYSEHSTGYVVDFGSRDRGGCPDAEACFAATAVGKWLLKNAPDFGFELSFPPGNRQGVKWEPWHWRWVGTSPAVPGAAEARRLFAAARERYPANPSPAQ